MELHGSNLKVECMSCHAMSDPEESRVIEELEDDRSAAPAITRGARDGICEICAASLERFCGLLGAEAGDSLDLGEKCLRILK